MAAICSGVLDGPCAAASVGASSAALGESNTSVRPVRCHQVCDCRRSFDLPGRAFLALAPWPPLCSDACSSLLILSMAPKDLRTDSNTLCFLLALPMGRVMTERTVACRAFSACLASFSLACLSLGEMG